MPCQQPPTLLAGQVVWNPHFFHLPLLFLLLGPKLSPRLLHHHQPSLSSTCILTGVLTRNGHEKVLVLTKIVGLTLEEQCHKCSLFIPTGICMDQHPGSHDLCHPIPSDNTPHTTPHLFTYFKPCHAEVTLSWEMLGDTPLHSIAPKPLSTLAESIPILTPSLHYKYPWTNKLGVRSIKTLFACHSLVTLFYVFIMFNIQTQCCRYIV